jgi:hypothetical protein
MARKTPAHTDLVAPREEEASAVRPRDAEASARPRQESSTELKAGVAQRRAHSSTRPAAGSLDDRLEKKMQRASELMTHLPPSDARVRLLHVASMRRDEALLDGLLAELNRAPPLR